MVLPITTAEGGKSPQAYVVNWANAAVTLAENTTLGLTLLLDRTSTEAFTIFIRPPASLPQGVTISWEGPVGQVPVAAGVVTAALVVEADNTVGDMDTFDLEILETTNVTPGTTSTTTVTTSAGGTVTDEVGEAWIGGIGGADRQLFQATFSLAHGEARPNFFQAAGAEAQIDVLAEMGRSGLGRRNLCLTGFSDNGGFEPGTAASPALTSSSGAGSTPSEAGVYPVSDPWTGFNIELRGIDPNVGANNPAANRARTNFTSPEATYLLRGVGAPGNSGPDLLRTEVRGSYVDTGVATAGLSNAGYVIAACTRRVDRDILLYEVFYTTSTYEAGEETEIQGPNQPGPVEFTRMDVDLPTGASGWTFRTLDQYQGDGGPLNATAILAKTPSSGRVHRVDGGMAPGFSFVLYNDATVTEAEADAVLQAQDCGLVIQGPRAVTNVGYGIGALNYVVPDWRKGGGTQRTLTDLNNRAQVDVNSTSNVLNTQTGGTRNRAGMHCVIGPSGAGQAGGTYVEAVTCWNMGAPNEVAGLCYFAECTTRRMSNAVFRTDTGQPVMDADFLQTEVNPFTGQNDQFTKVAMLFRDVPQTLPSGLWLSDIPSQANTGAGTAVERAFTQSGRTRIPDCSWHISPGVANPGTGGWSHRMSHQSRFNRNVEAWIVAKRFTGWMMCQLQGTQATRALTAHIPLTDAQGGPNDGSASSFLWLQAGWNMRESRVLNPIGQTQEFVYALWRDPAQTRVRALEGGYKSQYSRIFGWNVYWLVQGLATVRDPARRAMWHPDRAAAAEDEKSALRSIAYGLAHYSTGYGAFKRIGIGNVASPTVYRVNESNPNGQPYIPLRTVATRSSSDSTIPGGTIYPQSGSTAFPPDGVQRMNYDTDPSSSAQEQEWAWYNNWQGAIQAGAFGGLRDHLIGDGLPHSDPLLAGTEAAGAYNYYALHANEFHPEATADQIPYTNYMPLTNGTAAKFDQVLSLQDLENGACAWAMLGAGTGQYHYFSISLAPAVETASDPAQRWEDVSRVMRKMYGQGTSSNAAFAAFLKDFLWDAFTSRGYERNTSMMLGQFLARL